MRVNIISRGKRRSAVAVAAYRSGEKISCEYHDRTFFYPRKEGEVIHKQIFLPENAPEHLRDRAVLWNEVEWIEPSKKSRLAKEIRIALQCELTQEQNIALAQDFTQRLAEMGMCADLCVHEKGNGNIHAHVMITTRPFNPDGTWGRKSHEGYVLDEQGQRIRLPSGRYQSYKVSTTNWDEKETYLVLRQLYQDLTNEHLEKAGVDARICVKSYDQQGLDKEPTKYLGPYRSRLERQGIRTELGDLNREIVARNQLREALELQFDRWVEQAQATLKLEAARIEVQQQEIFRQVAASVREKDRALPDEVLQRRQEAYRREKRASWKPSGWKVKAKKDWQSVRARRKEQERETQQVANKQPSAVLHRLNHERTRRDEERSRHYAENVRTLRDKRTRYDEHNRGLREGKWAPERAFEPWQEELLERSFQVEYEKGRPAYLNALLFSRGCAVRTSDGQFVPEYAVEPPHHERPRKDEDRSSHYAENVRAIRGKRTRYDERNQHRREGKWAPERAFEPWQEKVLERSFQVEEEKAQPAYINALLFLRESAVRTSEGQFVPEYAGEPLHHDRLRRDTQQAEWIAIQELLAKHRPLQKANIPTPEEIAEYQRRAAKSGYNPEKRRLLEEEFGKLGRQEKADEYEWWLKQQQPGHNSRTPSTLHQFGKPWEPSPQLDHARPFRKRLSGLKRGRSP